MKKMLRTAACAAIAALALGACKKSSSKSKTELLTQANWKIVAQQEKSSATAAWGANIYLAAPACEKDNFVTFKTPNVFELNEGATKCFAADPQIETGVWAFAENETKLNVDGDIATIVQLDEGTLVLQSQDTFGGVTTYSLTTLSH